MAALNSISGAFHPDSPLSAYGAVRSTIQGKTLHDPDLIALSAVGDEDAETGPLAVSRNSNKFLNPITNGVVLPVLHFNGYKIDNPMILARIDRDELTGLFTGYGYTPYFIEGSDPPSIHQVMEDAPAGIAAAPAAGMASVGVARLGDEALLQAVRADLVVASFDRVDTTAVPDGVLRTRRATEMPAYA